MNVPKVNGQLGQESLHIFVSAVPRGESMDGKGVPQIMEARLIAGSIVSPHSRFLANPTE
jgi:hypothetical protein